MSEHSQESKPSYLVETEHNFADNEELANYLSGQLADGWELVSVIGGITFIFKAATQ